MSSEYARRLYDEYRRAATAGKAAMDAAAADNRELTAEERATRDRAFEDVTSLKAELDKIERLDTVLRESSTVELLTRDAAAVSGNRITARDVFRAVRERGHVSFDFRPTDPTLTLRALQSQGGTAVQTSFADYVAVYARTLTPMLRPDVVRVLDRVDGSPLIVPRVTADPNHGGTVTAEAAAINELDMTVSSVTLNPYKYGVINLWSSELDSDSALPIDQVIGESTARELTVDIGAHLTTGNDSGQPNGFITAATNGGTATGTGTTFGTYFGGTDLVALFYGLAAPYRENASWMANATTIAQMRNARATTGEFLWQPALSLGQPETLLGRPLYENPAMSNGSATKAVAVGDFSRYVVAMTPMRVQGSIHYKYSSDQIALRTIFRVDGDLVNTDAIRYLVAAAV
jgi:HK97 family phage major capsid protein